MKFFFLNLFCMSLLVGCGQMGPLYLPDQEPPIKVAKPKPVTSSPSISQ